MRITSLIVALLIAGACGLALYAYARERPQDVPWTRLDLARPIGLFTARKLTALRTDAPLCRALLDEAEIAHEVLPPRQGAQCGYRDGIRLAAARGDAPRYNPAGLGTSCAIAAALVIWEREIVQPAAREMLGTRVTAIDHFGSYSCRRLYGRSSGNWSEHATANAVDIAGFRLGDGRRITIAGDWEGGAAEARFLRAVRDGACRLFATTLSPDYNAAHHDHLHLDQANRGAGWRACR